MVSQPHQIEQIQGAGFTFSRGDFPGKVHRQEDIFQNGKGWQQLEKLENDPQVAAAPTGHLTFAKLVQRRAIHPHFTAGRPVDAGDHIQQGGFTAPRLADDADKFAALETQVNAL